MFGDSEDFFPSAVKAVPYLIELVVLLGECEKNRLINNAAVIYCSIQTHSITMFVEYRFMDIRVKYLF